MHFRSFVLKTIELQLFSNKYEITMGDKRKHNFEVLVVERKNKFLPDITSRFFFKSDN